MPVISIDLVCTDGVARASFEPPISGERFLMLYEQLKGLEFETLRSRVETAAADWQIAVDVRLLGGD